MESSPLSGPRCHDTWKAGSCLQSHVSTPEKKTPLAAGRRRVTTSRPRPIGSSLPPCRGSRHPRFTEEKQRAQRRWLAIRTPRAQAAWGAAWVCASGALTMLRPLVRRAHRWPCPQGPALVAESQAPQTISGRNSAEAGSGLAAHGSRRVSVLHRRARQPPYGTWTVSTGKHRAIKSQFAVLVLLASGTPRGPLHESARAVVGEWQAEPSRDAPIVRPAGLRSAHRALLPGPTRPSDPLCSAPARLHRGLEPLPGAWCRVHVPDTRCPSPYCRC